MTAPVVAASTGARTFTATIPAGTIADDLLVLFVSTFNSGCATPAGWTLQSSVGSGGGGLLYMFTKIAAKSEPSVGLSVNLTPGWCMLRITGYRATPLIEGAIESGAAPANGGTVDVAGPVTTVADCLLLGCATTAQSSNSRMLSSWSPPGATIVYTQNSINIAHTAKAVQAAAGDVGVNTFTFNGFSAYKAALVAAIAPAGATPSAPSAREGWGLPI